MFGGRPTRMFGAQKEQHAQPWWQPALQARQMAWQMRQKAQKMGLRSSLEFMKERAEQRTHLFNSFLNRIGTEIDTEPASISPYDTTNESGGTSTERTSTSGAKQPGNRALFAIFEQLDEDDFTKNGYPKVSVVNDMLEDKGHPRGDKETIDASFDRWWHEEKEEGTREDHDDDDEGKKPTQKALFSIFEKFEKHKGNDDYFTEDGYPKVSAVDRELNKNGYADTDQKSLRSAFKKWQEEEEDEHEGSGKKATHNVLFSVFEKFERHKKDDEYFTEDGYPRVSAVNEELEKKDYAPANQKTIHRAFKEWEEEEEEEGEKKKR
jgi:hypothetical protein